MTGILGRALPLVTALALAPSVAAEDWSFAIAGLVFDPPGESPFLSPIFYADHGALHLEARYNYEDLDTGSLFVGTTFEGGETVTFSAIPLFGVVLGNTNAVAPGAEIEVGWRRLSIYAESEYAVDLEESDDSFVYTWLEATVAPAEWLRFGLVAQRTRTYETGLDVQRGLLIEISRANLSLGFHWFNPDRSEDQVLVYAVGYDF